MNQAEKYGRSWRVFTLINGEDHHKLTTVMESEGFHLETILVPAIYRGYGASKSARPAPVRIFIFSRSISDQEDELGDPTIGNLQRGTLTNET